jgi:hypothetical protein
VICISFRKIFLTDTIYNLLTGSDLFHGSQKRKIKGQSLVNKDIVKFFYAERHSRLLLFNFSQIVNFTGNFKWENVVGRGAFGYVYKVLLPLYSLGSNYPSMFNIMLGCASLY